MPTNHSPKVIAFYLPQFHPIPENDEWWGKGFTEWRNVARAKPLYRGHYQPHLPADLGFYDLRVPEVRDAQADLAKMYGIHGFCYYYYWFGGRKLLDRPLREVLELGRPDFPFCICWANENWSRRWDGSEHEILLAQEHSHESDERFILDVIPILKDRRYIRISDKPLLLVYRVDLLPRPVETAQTWRTVAAAHGLPDLHLCAVQSFGISDPRPYGFDAAAEFPPHGNPLHNVEQQVSGVTLDFAGTIVDYRETARLAAAAPVPDYPLHRAVMVGWDNTPRRGKRGIIFANSTPKSYYDWLSALVHDSRTRDGASELIFINAWNEWAEGAHLEPDLKHGHAFLEATKQALLVTSPGLVPSEVRQQRPEPLVSVVIPSYNHARFIGDAISSVEHQTYGNIELVVIDDGSNDGSVRIIEKQLSETRLSRVVFRAHPNVGAATTIDRGITLSSGEYVAILNSDDVFAPHRIATLLQRVMPNQDVFLFSGVTFCDRDDRTIDVDGADPRIAWYKHALRIGSATPTAGFGLLAQSLTVSTSNFFFGRALFDKLGGFNNQLPQAHDWDFVLRVLRYTEPRFIPDELLRYRYHSTNATWDLMDRHLVEGRAALARYFAFTRGGTVNPLAPTRENWPLFFDFFCSNVSPWFAREMLRQYVPPIEGKGRTDGAGRSTTEPAPRRDVLAVERLRSALDERWRSWASAAALRGISAHAWADVEREHTTEPVVLPAAT